MLFSILHKTELSYDDRISESVIELRVAPPSNAHQSLRGFGLAVGPAAQIFEHLDWLGNRVHQFSVLEPHDRIVIVSHGAVETHPEPIDLAEPCAGRAELSDPQLREFLRFGGPVVDDPRLKGIEERLGLASSAADARSVVRAVGERLSGVLAYKKGCTKSTDGVAEVLAAGGGVCQDFSHVAIAILRRAGVPARYVSGYLHRAELPVLETHAWIEAFVPGCGWVGVDPTHASLVGAQHVVIAVGRSFADVPPNRGTFRGEAHETITATVTMERVESVPRGLMAPRPANIHVQTYSPVPRTAREHAHQPEQQQRPQQQLLPRQQQSQQQQ
jgi:transglutaminase-like putative cysteine protease